MDEEAMMRMHGLAGGHGGAEEAPDVMSVAKSIVKIFVSSNSPDHGQPYQLQRAQPSIGSGFSSSIMANHLSLRMPMSLQTD
jgi:hypothetical protein